MQLRSRSRPNTPAPASATKRSRQRKSANKNDEDSDNRSQDEGYHEDARKSLTYDDVQQVQEEELHPYPSIIPETTGNPTSNNPVRILTFSLCWSLMPLICLIIALYVGHATLGVVLYRTQVNVTSTTIIDDPILSVAVSPVKPSSLSENSNSTIVDVQTQTMNEAQVMSIMEDFKKLENSMTAIVQDQSQLKEQQLKRIELDAEPVVTVKGLRSMVEEILVGQSKSDVSTTSKDLMIDEVRHNISVQQHMLEDLKLQQTDMARNFTTQITNQLLSITQQQQQEQEKRQQEQNPLLDLAHRAIGTKVIFRPEELKSSNESPSMMSTILRSVRKILTPFSSSWLTSPTFFSSLASAPTVVYPILAQWKRWTSSSLNGPERALVRGHELGDCWAFPGSVGQLSLAFPHRVRPTAITLEHVSSEESISTNTAPRRFEILGLNYDATLDELQVIPYGDQFTYVQNHDAAQTFDLPLELVMESITGMMLKIHDNHGSPTYTCLYRFRVHGDVVES